MGVFARKYAVESTRISGSVWRACIDKVPGAYLSYTLSECYALDLARDKGEKDMKVICVQPLEHEVIVDLQAFVVAMERLAEIEHLEWKLEDEVIDNLSLEEEVICCIGEE